MKSTLTKRQERTYGPVQFTDNGTTYRIRATVRYDDRCGNGHNTFGITGQIDELVRAYWRDHSGGCVHEEIAKYFPNLAPLIKWHLTSADGSMRYIANTVYHAGDRDHNGLRKGERRQIRNGKTGKPCWELVAGEALDKYVDADERPIQETTLRYVPWECVGEGKERDLDAARRSAVWPDATDEELTAPGLKERLEARHDALMIEFRKAVESLGFVF